MKNTLRAVLILIAIILGVIYKHFNFSTTTFKDPWLDTLYIITFVAVLLVLIKSKNKSIKPSLADKEKVDE